MAWAQTSYPFGGSTTPLIAGAGAVPGSVANVTADGSQVMTVTLQNAFATAITSVELTPQGTGAVILNAQEVAAGRTAGQFQFIVTGGTPGSTCTVNYVVYGN